MPTILNGNDMNLGSLATHRRNALAVDIGQGALPGYVPGLGLLANLGFCAIVGLYTMFIVYLTARLVNPQLQQY